MGIDTSLDCPLMPDGEAREEAIREEIKRADWAVREPELEDEKRIAPSALLRPRTMRKMETEIL